MHRRDRVGLGDDQQLFCTCRFANIRWQHHEALRAVLVVVAHDAETAARHCAQDIFLVFAHQVIFAIAKEGEMIVYQPVEKLDAFADFRVIDLRRRFRQQVDDVGGTVAHVAPVFDRETHIVH